ncbi:hypothetical protein DYB36_011251 [Aphanomyces astaci]|uniref:Flap endonuclease 1 n=1 Tax=Aphanomyces astaci TaxID=112090 RepID=A0A397BJ94_APHAT|nr:hypothetical protein DYB36_011251 [Aphanomyces astaci]
MGIKGLMKLLTDEAPGCVKELQMSALSGRSVAIDASMALYQFLVAVRSNGEHGGAAQMLTNDAGDVTSHIQGMFNRTIRLMENGLKPVYVFDGKPPVMKGGELAKRTERRQTAQDNLKTATEEGNVEDIEKFNKRLVRATPQHNSDCKELLAYVMLISSKLHLTDAHDRSLMGVPFINAPCEAEATCAALAKHNKVFASGTEDMDVMTFGTPVLFRRLTIAASRKLPILEIKLDKVLAELELSYEQITVPDEWLGEDAIYKQARAMFLEPDVIDMADVDIKWKDPNVDDLRQFLVDKHGFSLDRVMNAIEKLKKAKTSHSQQRMESFFTVLPSSDSKLKRKADDKKAAKAKGTAAAKRGRKK